jgi:hypothetical protein
MSLNDDITLRDRILKNNNFQTNINNEIRSYNKSYGFFIQKISAIAKSWLILYSIIHLIFVAIYVTIVTEIPNDGIILILPPFINIIIMEFLYILSPIVFYLGKCNGDIIYIQEYYPEMAKKLWLPNGNNSFAWIKFSNYAYIDKEVDEFIDEIIRNTIIRFKIPLIIMLSNFGLIIISTIILAIKWS